MPKIFNLRLSSFRSMETERKGSLYAWSKKYKGLADIISNQSLQVNKRDGFWSLI